MRDRLLRALADMENTCLRADRAGEEARKFAIAEFARELLIVVDNLERTVESARIGGVEAPQSPLLTGVEATLRVLIQTLTRFGIQRMGVLGHPFDPHQYEALMDVDDSSQPAGTIVRVVDQGYTIHGKLLRPARVIITKRRGRPEPPSSDNDLGWHWDHHRPACG